MRSNNLPKAQVMNLHNMHHNAEWTEENYIYTRGSAYIVLQRSGMGSLQVAKMSDYFKYLHKNPNHKYGLCKTSN
jgi:hypothetical protein